MRIRPAALVAAALSGSLVLGACGAGAAAPGATAGPPDGQGAVRLPSDFAMPGLETTYEAVTLADDAAIVDRATVRDSLQAIDPTEDGATLRFASGAEAVKALQPGQVVAFESVGIGRIRSVQEENGQVVVNTTGATLAEFVKDGVLAWDVPVRFDQLPEEAYVEAAAADGYQLVAVAGDLPPGVAAELAAAKTELNYKGRIRDFDVDWKLVPSADKIDFDLKVSRSNVAVTAKGYVTSFRQGARFEYDNGTATLVESSVSGMRGEAEITWAATQVKDPRDKVVEMLKMPLSVPFPIQVGPVPMTLSFKANVRIVPAFETDKGSSGGSFKLSYDSDHGFSSSTRGAISPISRVKAFTADLGSKETVTAGLGPTGFAVGVEFPRLELALGYPASGGLFKTYAFITLDQYANGQFTPGTTLSSHIPPCQRADIKVSAVAGYNFEVLGMLQVSDKTELWTKKTEKFLDGRPCTLLGS